MKFTGEFAFLICAVLGIIASAIGGVELANLMWGF